MFSPVWLLVPNSVKSINKSTNREFWLKKIPHWLHTLSVYILWCSVRFSYGWNLSNIDNIHIIALHMNFLMQKKGRTLAKEFPHWWHSYDFSPAWVVWCEKKVTVSKYFPYSLHSWFHPNVNSVVHNEMRFLALRVPTFGVP